MGCCYCSLVFSWIHQGNDHVIAMVCLTLFFINNVVVISSRIRWLNGHAIKLHCRLFIEGSDSQRSGANCLRFFYTMNGFHTGTLLVYVIRNGVRQQRWFLRGDQLQDWHQAAVELNLDGVSQVRTATDTRS